MAGEFLILVEDDEVVAEGVAEVLTLEGYRVRTLFTGASLLGIISLTRPDIIILDVSLPDVNGVDLAKSIRRFWPELPIVFTTGHDADRIDAQLRDGHTYILQKPFELAELIELLGRITGAP